MNLDAILQPVIDFFSEGIGAVLRDIAEAVYMFLFPANAEAAHPIEIPF